MDPASGGAYDVPVGDRDLIEYTMDLILPTLPLDWISMRGIFAPTIAPPIASVHVLTPRGWQPVAVTSWALGAVADHQRRAMAAGMPWQRLTVDRHRDGRLDVHAEAFGDQTPVPASVPTPKPEPKVKRPTPRWIRRTVAAVTLGCFAASAALLMISRPWEPPPRADIIAVPPPAPRQQEALEVLTQWYDARNRADGAAMRALTCAEPSKSVLRDITAIEQHGTYDRIVFFDAIAQFDERKDKFLVTIAYRPRPVSEKWRDKVANTPGTAGFFRHDLTLTDENGLKVCDIDEIA